MVREAGERDKRSVSWLQANILAHSNTTALAAGCCQARPHWPAPPYPGPSLALPGSMPPALRLGTVCSSLTGFAPYQSNGTEERLPAFPIHLPRPFYKVLAKQSPYCGRHSPLTADLRSPAERYPLLAAELSSAQMHAVVQPSASGLQVQCAFLTAAVV